MRVQIRFVDPALDRVQHGEAVHHQIWSEEPETLQEQDEHASREASLIGGVQMLDQDVEVGSPCVKGTLVGS